MDFNIEAANWDNEKRIKRAKIIADKIAKSIEIKENYNAMEFGCGTGLLSFNLCDKFRHIVLIDSSKGMIEVVNKKIQKLNGNSMTALEMDINIDTTLAGNFDVIYTSMALHHIVDIETTIKKLYGLLNKDGYLCIVDLVEDDGSFHKKEKDFDGHNGFNQSQLQILLEQIGFRDVSTSVFYTDIKVIDGSNINYSLFIMVARKSF